MRGLHHKLDLEVIQLTTASRNPPTQEISPSTFRDKIIAILDKDIFRKSIAALSERKTKISQFSIHLNRAGFMEALTNIRLKRVQGKII